MAYKIYNNFKKGGTKAVLPIEEAKSVPIETLCPDIEKMKNSPYRISGCCPFPDHEDSSPSFIINKNKNTFKCFGCQKSGSSIDFVMHYHGFNFVQAVKFINETK